jgi:hypothetical protein
MSYVTMAAWPQTIRAIALSLGVGAAIATSCAAALTPDTASAEPPNPGPVIATPGYICHDQPATIVPRNPDADNEITGTAGDDVIYAGAGNDDVNGRGGHDTICGGSGDDYLYGGPGEDWIYGQEGQDSVLGQSGYDRWLDVEDGKARGGYYGEVVSGGTDSAVCVWDRMLVDGAWVDYDERSNCLHPDWIPG